MGNKDRITGGIQTKPLFVKLILDLINFTPEYPIGHKSILDPGCGNGAFLLEALKRSLTKAIKQNIDLENWTKNVEKLFVGYEINPKLCRELRDKIYRFFVSRTGIKASEARSLASRIVIRGDFLKWEPERKFDIIIGNPPYVRYDNLERRYVHWLRSKYSCFKGRADLYIPFIQHSLKLLSKEGKLAFICTNRFTLCEYGESLRDLITNNYSISKIIDLTETKPFTTPVSTYPWVFVFKCKENNQNILYCRINESLLVDSSLLISKLEWREIESNSFSKTPWRIPDPNLVKLWKEIKRENRMKLGDSDFGVEIKVGIATGADKVFINPPSEAQIESDLLTPIVLSHTLKDNHHIKKTDDLLNTWDPDNPSKLIELNDWPNTSRYLDEHKKKLISRYIAKRNPILWYRLIDHPDLKILEEEKLVFPSLRRSLEVYFDDGICIPHHNCYYAVKTSEGSPSLKAIGALLSSNTVRDLASVLAIQFNGKARRLMKSSFLEIPMPEPHLIQERERELETATLLDDDGGEGEINSIVREMYRIE
ncbi:MAG: Eco57I restriction-modification methylase domain-containing protein [Candidatus Hodarchaeota archaeon]